MPIAALNTLADKGSSKNTKNIYALARIRRTLQFHTDANCQVFVPDFEGGRTCVVYEADAQDCGRKIYMWEI